MHGLNHVTKIYPNTLKIVNGLFIDATNEHGVPFPLVVIEPVDDNLTDFAMDADRCQSRVEAFWRTLLINTCGGYEPAPLQFGYAFSDWLNLYLSKAFLQSMHAEDKEHLDLAEKFRRV